MNRNTQSQKNIQYKMLIAAANYKAFRAAADSGNIKTLEFLLDKAKLLDVQSKILAANNYEVFRVAATGNGNIEVLKLLLDRVELPEERHTMLVANNYEAFREAAAESNIKALEFLLDRAGLPEEQYAMLVANACQALRIAASEGNIEVLELLLDKAGSPKEQYAMLAAYNHKMLSSHIIESHEYSSEEFKRMCLEAVINYNSKEMLDTVQSNLFPSSTRQEVDESYQERKRKFEAIEDLSKSQPGPSGYKSLSRHPQRKMSCVNIEPGNGEREKVMKC